MRHGLLVKLLGDILVGLPLGEVGTAVLEPCLGDRCGLVSKCVEQLRKLQQLISRLAFSISLRVRVLIKSFCGQWIKCVNRLLGLPLAEDSFLRVKYILLIVHLFGREALSYLLNFAHDHITPFVDLVV